MKTEGKKKQVAQNTVEYDGIKLQYYNQSLEKNYPYRKKKKIQRRCLWLIWRAASMLRCSPNLGQTSRCHQGRILPPVVKSSYSLFCQKDSALKGHHFTISTVISQTLL